MGKKKGTDSKMKALDFAHATIGSVNSRADKSVRFSVETCELTNEQAASLLAYHGTAARVFIAPHEVEIEELLKIENSREQKTPSQRLRNTLYVWFKQQNPVGHEGQFQQFYDTQMERLINSVKEQLDPQ